jgi:hypothetical protein
VIRSIATCLKGRAPCSVVIQYKGVFFQCVAILFCWHVAHPLMYSGLKNHCNVWQFWTGCNLALDGVGIALSIGGIVSPAPGTRLACMPHGLG